MTYPADDEDGVAGQEADEERVALVEGGGGRRRRGRRRRRRRRRLRRTGWRLVHLRGRDGGMPTARRGSFGGQHALPRGGRRRSGSGGSSRVRRPPCEDQGQLAAARVLGRWVPPGQGKREEARTGHGARGTSRRGRRALGGVGTCSFLGLGGGGPPESVRWGVDGWRQREAKRLVRCTRGWAGWHHCRHRGMHFVDCVISTRQCCSRACFARSPHLELVRGGTGSMHKEEQNARVTFAQAMFSTPQPRHSPPPLVFVSMCVLVWRVARRPVFWGHHGARSWPAVGVGDDRSSSLPPSLPPDPGAWVSTTWLCFLALPRHPTPPTLPPRMLGVHAWSRGPGASGPLPPKREPHDPASSQPAVGWGGPIVLARPPNPGALHPTTHGTPTHPPPTNTPRALPWATGRAPGPRSAPAHTPEPTLPKHTPMARDVVVGDGPGDAGRHPTHPLHHATSTATHPPTPPTRTAPSRPRPVPRRPDPAAFSSFTRERPFSPFG